MSVSLGIDFVSLKIESRCCQRLPVCDRKSTLALKVAEKTLKLGCSVNDHTWRSEEVVIESSEVSIMVCLVCS